MTYYQQLTRVQRYQIAAYLKANLSFSGIASFLSVSTSTISREVNRNGGRQQYKPDLADNRAALLKFESHKNTKITQPHLKLIAFFLDLDFSPEQIATVLKRHCNFSIAFQSIYRILREDFFNKGNLFKQLRLKGKHSNYCAPRRVNTSRSSPVANRVSIEQRPPIIEQRTRLGDWEIDTIHGAQKQGNLLTIVERVSRLTLIKYLPKRTAEAVEKATIELLMPYKNFVLSITSDNGSEFANHEKISQALDAKFYFAHPYSSWERGTNENTNGLIRQYFPKKKPLDKVTEDQVKHTMERLNFRPRKCLDFKTPLEIFFNKKPFWAM